MGNWNLVAFCLHSDNDAIGQFPEDLSQLLDEEASMQIGDLPVDLEVIAKLSLTVVVAQSERFAIVRFVRTWMRKLEENRDNA